MLGLVRTSAAGTADVTRLRAETAVEELLTNTVLHGASAVQPDSRVWLAASMNRVGGLMLQYQDTCLEFDPKPKINEALQRTANPMDQRPLGGLGLLMVYRLADEFRYVRRDGRNCIDLAFQEQRSAVVTG